MTEDKKIAIEHGILDIIEQQEGRVTQTELSNNLRISIGLLNAYLRNLIKKGYVKVSNVKASTVRYMLTAEGMAEKYRLTTRYMSNSLDHYKKIKQAVEARIVRLKLEEVRTVVFVGSGDIAEIMHLYLGETKIKLLGVFDDGVLPEELFFGHKVRPLSELAEYFKQEKVDKVLLNYLEDIETKEQLIKSMGIPQNNIETKW
ncbi:MAG TPA: winged helix-turn-helix transcriptional regulator [bacterium]|nr:winged helix-turn-helix transcriptional regulator [bacterium]